MESYICYFDLLGTQELVKNSPGAYIDKINTFALRLKNALSTFDNAKDLRIYVFSDSVYLEANSLKLMCDFMTIIRSDLFSEEIFFNAAICRGSLDIKRNEEYSRLGYFFEGQDAVKAYREQASFTGIGIHISKDLTDIIKERIITSTYIAFRYQDGSFDFVDYYDLKYSGQMQEQIDIVLSAFVNSYLINRRASRYYFSVICSMLKSALSDGKNIENQIVNCLEALRVVDDSNLRMAMILKMFEIASKIKEDDVIKKSEEWIREEITPVFELFWRNYCFSELPEFSKYNKEVISQVLKISLSILITNKLSPQKDTLTKNKHEYSKCDSRMIEAVAHDLKSPMAAITACAENISDNVNTEKKEYYAGKIQEKVEQMNRILNSILEYSESENSTAVINNVNINIGDVVEKIIVYYEHMIIERSLKINSDKCIVTIKTDIKLFQQAISNLIENAILYSKVGTEIDISFNEKSLVISNITAKEVDNPEELKQPFVKGSVERGTPGSGLGLAIAENNLAIIGFKLEIHSNDGRFVAIVKM